MTVKVAHKNPLRLRLIQASYCSGIAAVLIFFGCESLQNATAEGETRTISLHHIHTNEDLTITYKVNGRYDENALSKIDSLLRDWREDKSIRMDAHLLDLLWEVHREVGAKEPIWIVCGYRSPSTNSALRRRSSGVAKFSQHMRGRAIDFYIPGVPLEQLRAAGLRAQRGGVGYYPSSGAPFVHLDSGNVRHWPRMPEAQLASVLSKGQLSSRYASDARGTTIARGDIQRSSQQPSFLARLFGTSKGEDEEADSSRASKSKAAEPARAAKPEPKAEKVATLPLPPSRPAKPDSYQVAAPAAKSGARPGASDEPVVATKPGLARAVYEVAAAGTIRPVQVASLLARSDMTATDIINERGYWQGLPSTEPAEAPQISSGRVASGAAPTSRRAAAGADTVTTARVTPWPLADRSESEPLPNALAYAAQPTPIASARAVPMGTSTPRAAPAAQGDTTIVVKRSEERLLERTAKVEDHPSAMTFKGKLSGVVRVGDRFNDPWIRAMIVSPSAHSFLKTTLLGMPDFRNLGPYLVKPATSVVMTFTDDPHLGMTSETFAGSAVVFISTVAFSARTAALR